MSAPKCELYIERGPILLRSISNTGIGRHEVVQNLLKGFQVRKCRVHCR